MLRVLPFASGGHVGAVDLEFHPGRTDDFGNPLRRECEEQVCPPDALAWIYSASGAQDGANFREFRCRREVSPLELIPPARGRERVAGNDAVLDRIVENCAHTL